MFKKIQFKDFRAFKGEHQIKLSGAKQKNLLIYGENGAGKSSLYDAFELFYFYNAMEADVVRDAIDASDANQKRLSWKNSYLCKMASSASITLKINDTDYDSIADRTEYEVFMISNRSTPYDDRLSLKTLLKGVRFTGLDIDSFLADGTKRSLMLEYVNEALKDVFLETISVEFDQTPDYCLKFTDSARNNLSEQNHLSRYFNEAKIKLVSLLALFAVAILSMSLTDRSKKKIIVFDDIVNSLDAANRTLLMKYIFKMFNKDDIQIVMMTHNVSYYNLWMHYTNQLNEHENWCCLNLYVSGDKHNVYYHTMDDNVDSIEQAYKSNPADANVGNRLRQLFERYLFELAKISQVGPFNESKDLIGFIINKKHLYLNIAGNNRMNDFYEMMEEVRKNYKRWCVCSVRSKLSKMFEKYDSTNDFDYIKNVIDDATLFQKVVLHQASHGHDGKNSYSDKEIRAIIALLKVLEKAVVSNRDKDVYTI